MLVFFFHSVFMYHNFFYRSGVFLLVFFFWGVGGVFVFAFLLGYITNLYVFPSLGLSVISSL